MLKLNSAIYDLDSFLNKLTTVDEIWKIDFRSLRLDIEVEYSLALDQRLEDITDEEKIVIKKYCLIWKK